MSTIVNTPSGGNGDSGGNAVLVAVVVIVAAVLIVLFFIYGLPALRQAGPTNNDGGGINIPDEVDINVNGGGDNGGGDNGGGQQQ